MPTQSAQIKPIDFLKNIDNEAKREKYPNVPDHALPRSRHKNSDKTNSITAAVMDYIKFMGGHPSRINTQGQWDEKLGRWRKSNSTDGVADVVACFRGRYVAVEVKAGKDTVNEKQKLWRQRLTQAGGYYFVARDFASFFNWFNQEFDINPEHFFCP